MPKLRPDTVTDAYPLCGAFRRTTEATAASKLNTGLPVPDTEATVTLAAWKTSPNGLELHANVVADVHAVVMDIPRSPSPPCSSPADAVWFPAPKFSPDTVKDV